MNTGICYIVGAGEIFSLDFQPTEQDIVIAADGGYRNLCQAGIRPNLVVGDFDSLGAAPQGEQVIVLPKVKDVTDTWAAIREGEARGFRQFFLYGCTGGRLDHTLANIQTAADVAARGMECKIYDKTQIITAICGGTLHFGTERTGFISVFSHSDRCTGVCIRGMKYELEQAELSNRFPLGVSNEFQGVPSEITIGTGTAILVYDR